MHGRVSLVSAALDAIYVYTRGTFYAESDSVRYFGDFFRRFMGKKGINKC